MALHYILDGYNIIKCTDRLADCSLEEGRNGLLRILNHDRPQGSSRHCVMVVFDGKDDVWGQRPSGEVKVVFTSGETADDYIKRAVEKAGDVRNTIVVTNDREIVCYIKKLGAQALSVQKFLNLKVSSSALRHKTGRSSGQKSRKQITRMMEHHINKELEDVWINKKRSE